MRKEVRHELADDRSINMTPMIDVVFQLILFFMLTSSLAHTREIAVDLPKSSSATTPDKKEKQPLVVSYRLNGKRTDLRLNGKPIDGLGRLAAAMQKAAPPATGPKVDIQMDRQVRYQDVVKLMDAVREAGYTKMSLGVLAGVRSTK